MAKIDEDKIYKSSFVAQYFSVTAETLKRWWKRGDITAITIQSRRYYKGSEILRFENKRTGGKNDGE